MSNKRVILFVDDTVDIMTARIPDDSLLVGYSQRPLERTPEFIMGPRGDVLYPILEPGAMAGYACERCQDRGEKRGYVIEPVNLQDREIVLDWKPVFQDCVIGVFQCGNCGMILFPEQKSCVDAGVQ